MKRANGTAAFFLLLGGIHAANGQETAPAPVLTLAASDKPAGEPPVVTYVDGQLKVNARDASLRDILDRIAAVTGVKIDIPAAATADQLPFIELGPGPPRQILAELLNDWNFDYLIQSSEADPEKVRSVLLMTRAKKSPPIVADAAHPARSPFLRNAPAPVKPADDTVVADPTPVPPPDQPAPDPAAVTPPAAPPAEPDLSAPSSPQGPALQPAPLAPGVLRPGALSPPPVLNPQSMSDQLQQMYQQRMQMKVQPPAPGQTNPGGN